MLLNETLVNDATRGRVYKTTALIFNEKALGDPLVHHYDRDFGFLGHLVVEQIDRSLKLRNL